MSDELLEAGAAGVVYVDLDRFKGVNDTFGHAAGDELLVEASARLRAGMRADDRLGRLGGDEFLIVLHRVEGAEDALAAGRRISEAVCGSYQLSCASVELVVSVGVAFGGGTLGAEELIERADGAMYRSKRAGTGSPILATG